MNNSRPQYIFSGLLVKIRSISVDEFSVTLVGSSTNCESWYMSTKTAAYESVGQMASSWNHNSYLQQESIPYFLSHI